MRVRLFPSQLTKNSLNPCCNGIYSMSDSYLIDEIEKELSLNPCCNGIYSMRIILILYLAWLVKVLILVVMEYTQ